MLSKHLHWVAAHCTHAAGQYLWKVSEISAVFISVGINVLFKKIFSCIFVYIHVCADLNICACTDVIHVCAGVNIYVCA